MFPSLSLMVIFLAFRLWTIMHTPGDKPTWAICLQDKTTKRFDFVCVRGQTMKKISNGVEYTSCRMGFQADWSVDTHTLLCSFVMCVLHHRTISHTCFPISLRRFISSRFILTALNFRASRNVMRKEYFNKSDHDLVLLMFLCVFGCVSASF
jgi:hypothetical protein